MVLSKNQFDSFSETLVLYRRTIYQVRIHVKTMGQEKRDPETLLPLSTSVFHILLALSDGDLHGYGIMQEVSEHTEGQIKLGPGTLYGAIKRLLSEHLIVEADERPDPELDDERRRYYRLTEFGQKVLKAELRRISKMVSVAQSKRLIPKPRN
jgi:DNA-binding PadR family transcriptional regulator